MEDQLDWRLVYRDEQDLLKKEKKREELKAKGKALENAEKASEAKLEERDEAIKNAKTEKDDFKKQMNGLIKDLRDTKNEGKTVRNEKKRMQGTIQHHKSQVKRFDSLIKAKQNELTKIIREANKQDSQNSKRIAQLKIETQIKV